MHKVKRKGSRTRMAYMIEGQSICAATFIHLHACCAQPGQTGLFTQSCCDLVVPWPHTGVSFQVLLPAGGIM